MSRLPEGWVAVRVDEIADVRLGRQRSPDQALGPNMRPYLRAANVTWNGLDISDVKEMNFDPHEVPSYVLQKGDILLTEASGSPSEVGKPAVFNGEIEECCFQNTLIRVRAASGLSDFLYYRFLYDASSGAFGQASRGLGIHHLGADAVAKWNVELPPLDEQGRIVSKVKTLLSRCRQASESLEEIRDLFEDYSRSVLISAFRGELTADWRASNTNVESSEEFLARVRLERRRRWEEAELTKLFPTGGEPTDRKWMEKYEEPETIDVADLPELPEGWSWTSWAQVGFCQNGRSFPSSAYVPRGVKLLRPGNLRVNGNVEWNEENTKFLPTRYAEENPDYVVAGDELLMNLTAQSLKDEFLGRVCLSSPGECCLLNQRIARLTPILLSTRFCFWLFKSPLVRRYIAEIATGSLIQHISTSQVERFLLPVPPAAEQVEIVRQIEAMMSRSLIAHEGYVNSVNDLSGLAQSVVTSACRGELVPQDPTETPASSILERIRLERAETATNPPQENPATPSKRLAMHNHDMNDRVRVAILQQEFDRFSFDDLRAKVPGSYDELKASLFALLDERSPIVRQYYDRQAKAMRFERTKL